MKSSRYMHFHFIRRYLKLHTRAEKSMARFHKCLNRLLHIGLSWLRWRNRTYGISLDEIVIICFIELWPCHISRDSLLMAICVRLIQHTADMAVCLQRMLSSRSSIKYAVSDSSSSISSWRMLTFYFMPMTSQAAQVLVCLHFIDMF